MTNSSCTLGGAGGGCCVFGRGGDGDGDSRGSGSTGVAIVIEGLRSRWKHWRERMPRNRHRRNRRGDDDGGCLMNAISYSQWNLGGRFSQIYHICDVLRAVTLAQCQKRATILSKSRTHKVRVFSRSTHRFECMCQSRFKKNIPRPFHDPLTGQGLHHL